MNYMIFKNRTNKSLSYGQKRMERQSHKVGSRSCHLRTDNYVTPKLLSTCDTHYVPTILTQKCT